MSPEGPRNYPNRVLQPSEMIEVRREAIPDEAFIALNGLIAERLHGQFARVTLKSIVERMVELGLDSKEIKMRNWHRLGSVYERNGWKVKYHSPSVDDNDYEPYYFFDTGNERVW